MKLKETVGKHPGLNTEIELIDDGTHGRIRVREGDKDPLLGKASIHLTVEQLGQLADACHELASRICDRENGTQYVRPRTACPPGFLCVHEPKCPGCA